MTGELETAALASGGGWLRWKRQHAEIPPGTPCANCETPLEGTYCHVCGQLAEDFHKSVWKLTVEAVESLLHLDGRLFQTMPALFRRPGALTRDYLEGKRAYQVQPFRMFLVILLVVIFAGHWATTTNARRAEASGETTHNTVNIVGPGGSVGDSAARAQARAEIAADTDMTEAEKTAALAAIDGDWARFGRAIGENAASGAGAAADDQIEVTSRVANEAQLSSIQHWAQTRLDAVRDDPERFALILEIWGHRVAILALPVSALMLTVLFAFNRRYFVFDHLVFSMHSLSFQMLLLTVIFLVSMVIGAPAWWLLLASPVHLFVHMKGAYQRSTIGTLVRMFVLFNLTSVTFTLLALLWLYLGFNDMAGGH
ncbi:MAG: DUF3667 domain-containing protein [Brevundimonas sp.]